MGSSFEDTLFDFDINYLAPSNNTELRTDKQRRDILLAKKKIIATHSLLKKYYNCKEKLDQNEVNLLTANEECKKVCIDYKEVLEKCSQLQKDGEALHSKNAELEAKLTLSQNQFEGMKAHANQLQLLVKDQESVIEALKVEKHLEKNNSDDYEKNLSSIQKENEILVKHLYLVKDVALGRKKLSKHHKILLQKYDNVKYRSDEEDCLSESSCQEPDLFEDPPHSPLFSLATESSINKTEHNICEPVKLKICDKKDTMTLHEDDSDYSNGVISEDTGRGSSLAFSDGEKCFNSPEYYNTDSPTEISRINDKPILINPMKTPKTVNEVVHVATSPLIFDDETLLCDNNLLFCDDVGPSNLEYFITEIPLSDEIVTIKEKRQLCDVGTSPVKDIESVNTATSPILFEELYAQVGTIELNQEPGSDLGNKENNENVCFLSNINLLCSKENTPCNILMEKNEKSVNGKHTIIDNLSSHCEIEISGKSIEERKCLEINNSKNFCDEDSRDDEIAMILNSMRFTQRLLTPIPKTPAKVARVESSKTQRVVQETPELHTDCNEAQILIQENNFLRSNMAELRKDVTYIKSLLKNHFLAPDKSNLQIFRENRKFFNAEFFDTTSQETLYISADHDDDNRQIGVTENSNIDLSKSTSFQEPARFPNHHENEDNNFSTKNKFVNNCDILEKAPPSIFIMRDTPPIEECEVDDSVSIVDDIDDDPINCTRESISFENDVRSEDENDIIINNGVGLTLNEINPSPDKAKIKKHKKLTKLGRFKQKLLPKYKISANSLKPKLKKIIPIPKKKTRMDDVIAILNNKSAYDKAAKVVAEMKSKEFNSLKKFNKRKGKRLPDTKKNELKEDKLNLCLEKQQQLFKSNQSKIPIVCLSNLEVDNEQIKRYTRRKLNYQQDVTDKIKVKLSSKEGTIADTDIVKGITANNPNVASKRVLRSSSKEDSVTEKYIEKEICTDSLNVTSKSARRSSKGDTFENTDFTKEVIIDSSNIASRRVLRSSSKGETTTATDIVKVTTETLNIASKKVRHISKGDTITDTDFTKEVITHSPKVASRRVLRGSSKDTVAETNIAKDIIAANRSVDSKSLLQGTSKDTIAKEIAVSPNNASKRVLRGFSKDNIAETDIAMKIITDNTNVASRRVLRNSCKDTIAETYIAKDIITDSPHVASRRVLRSSSKDTIAKEITAVSPNNASKRVLRGFSKDNIAETDIAKEIITDNTNVASSRVLRSSSKDTITEIENAKEIITVSPKVASGRVLRNSSKGNNTADSDISQEIISDSPKVSSKRVSRSSSKGDNVPGIDIAKNTNSPHKDSKRVMRSSTKQYTIADTAFAMNDISNRNVISNRNRDPKLQNGENGKLNVRNSLESVLSSPINNRKRKLSNTENSSDTEYLTEKSDGKRLKIQNNHPKQSILCRMLEKYGRNEKISSKKVSDNITNSICKKLQEDIASINDLPASKANQSMYDLANEVQGWNLKQFMSGFMKYLKDPERKRELFNKVNSQPAPPMTKSEQVLLYIVRHMNIRKPYIVETILNHIEYSLFQLNRTPDFDTIESVSHFYALLCRYFGLKQRLRLFLLDAMYCLQFKVVPLIKQCLDVWMHILPLAHMGIAKCPLVTCLVYLLHFYKCEDRFNRVQDIRFILSRKYFYQITDWNESKILEMFKNAIREVREITAEKKMLRIALIILCKRQGPKWCQKNIIQNMLMPMIEADDVSMAKRQFCIEMLGALLKPFPADMKVHVEITFNHLLDMLQKNPPDCMKEAIFTSLIYLNNYNASRVTQSLLTWMPKKVSSDFEKLLKDYVRGKPIGAWKKILSRISV